MSNPLPFVKLGAGNKVGGAGGTPFNATIATTQSGSSLLEVTISQPPVNTEWAITAPKVGQALNTATGVTGIGAGGTWVQGPLWLRLLTGTATLSTPTNGPSRYLGLYVLDDTGIRINEHGNDQAVTGAAASQRVVLGIGPVNGVGGAANDGVRQLHLQHVGVPLFPGYTLGSITANRQSTDQWSSLTLLFESWTSLPNFDPYGPMLI